jgi:hypothetical protein
MVVGGQHHAPAALPRGKRPGTHIITGWVGPRAGLDGCGNLAPTGIRSPDHSVRTSCYTDYAIPAHTHGSDSSKYVVYCME